MLDVLRFLHNDLQRRGTNKLCFTSHIVINGLTLHRLDSITEPMITQFTDAYIHRYVEP